MRRHGVLCGMNLLAPDHATLLATVATTSPTELASLHARGGLDAALDAGLLVALAAEVEITALEDGGVGASALLNLLAVDPVARRFAEEVGEARAVAWMEPGDDVRARVGVRAVSWLVWHRNRGLRVRVARAGAVPLLLGRLHTDLEAVDALARLAASPETLGALVDASAFDALASHLPRWVTDVTCLHALWPSLAHPEVRRGLVAAGWPNALRPLLRHDGACRLLARLMSSMTEDACVQAMYDLAGWEASLRTVETGVGERNVARCLPALRVQIMQELCGSSADPRRDIEALLRAYRRYDAVGDFRRENSSALSRIRLARSRAAIDGRYRALLDAWACGDAVRADMAIAQLSASAQGLMRVREDFEKEPHVREALVCALRSADSMNDALRWSSTYAFAAQVATRGPVSDLLGSTENLVVFARPWLHEDESTQARVGGVRVEPDAHIADAALRVVLQATLAVLARHVHRAQGFALSLPAITSAARSPHEEIVAPAVRVGRALAWQNPRQ